MGMEYPANFIGPIPPGATRGPAVVPVHVPAQAPGGNNGTTGAPSSDNGAAARAEEIRRRIAELQAQLAELRRQIEAARQAAIQAQRQAKEARDKADAAKAQAERTKTQKDIAAHEQAEQNAKLEEARFQKKYYEFEKKDREIALAEAQLKQKQEQLKSPEGKASAATDKQVVDAQDAKDKTERTLNVADLNVQYQEAESKALAAEHHAEALMPPGWQGPISPEAQAGIDQARRNAAHLRELATAAKNRLGGGLLQWDRGEAGRALTQAGTQVDTTYKDLQTARAGGKPEEIAKAELAWLQALEAQRIAQKQLEAVDKQIAAHNAEVELQNLRTAQERYERQYSVCVADSPEIVAAEKKAKDLRTQADKALGEIKPMGEEAQQRATVLAVAPDIEKGLADSKKRTADAQRKLDAATTADDIKAAKKELADAHELEKMWSDKQRALDAVRKSADADYRIHLKRRAGQEPTADELKNAQTLREDANKAIQDATKTANQTTQGIELEKKARADLPGLKTSFADLEKKTADLKTTYDSAESTLQRLADNPRSDPTKLADAQKKRDDAYAAYQKALGEKELLRLKVDAAEKVIAWRDGKRDLTLYANGVGGHGSPAADMYRRAQSLPPGVDPNDPLVQALTGSRSIDGRSTSTGATAQDMGERVTHLEKQAFEALGKTGQLEGSDKVEGDLKTVELAFGRKLSADKAVDTAAGKVTDAERALAAATTPQDKADALLKLDTAKLELESAKAGQKAAQATHDWAESHTELLRIEHSFVLSGGDLARPSKIVEDARAKEARLRAARDEAVNEASLQQGKNNVTARRNELKLASDAHARWKRDHPYLPEQGSATLQAVELKQRALTDAERQLTRTATVEADAEATRLSKQKLPMDAWVKDGEQPTASQKEALYNLVKDESGGYSNMRVMSQPMLNRDFIELGGEAIVLQGRQHIENVVGLSLLGSDKARGLDGIATPQGLEQALKSRRIFAEVGFEQREMLDKVVGTIVDQGGENAKVKVIHFTYATPQTGVVKSALFEVTKKDGTIVYVDEHGRDYDSGNANDDNDNLNDFFSTNMLPPGDAVIAIPKNGKYTVDASGNVELHVGDARTERWDQRFRRENNLDMWVAVGGVIAGTVLAVGSLGMLSVPGVAIAGASIALVGSGVYGVAVSSESLIDQHRHGWDGERAWLDGVNLLASALCIPAVGASGRAITLAGQAGRASDDASRLALEARAAVWGSRAKTLAVPTMTVGFVALEEGARYAIENWDSMTEEQKSQQKLMFVLNAVDIFSPVTARGYTKVHTTVRDGVGGWFRPGSDRGTTTPTGDGSLPSTAGGRTTVDGNPGGLLDTVPLDGPPPANDGHGTLPPPAARDNSPPAPPAVPRARPPVVDDVPLSLTNRALAGDESAAAGGEPAAGGAPAGRRSRGRGSDRDASTPTAPNAPHAATRNPQRQARLDPLAAYRPDGNRPPMSQRPFWSQLQLQRAAQHPAVREAVAAWVDENAPEGATAADRRATVDAICGEDGQRSPMFTAFPDQAAPIVEAALRRLEHAGTPVFLDGFAPATTPHTTLYQIRPSRPPRLDSTESVAAALDGVTPQSTRIAQALRDGDIELHVLNDGDFRRLYTQRQPDRAVPAAFADGHRIYLNQRSTQNDGWVPLIDVVHEGTHALDSLSGFDAARHPAGSSVLVGDLEGRAMWHQMAFAQALGLSSDAHPLLGSAVPPGRRIDAAHTMQDAHDHIALHYPHAADVYALRGGGTVRGAGPLHQREIEGPRPEYTPAAELWPGEHHRDAEPPKVPRLQRGAIALMERNAPDNPYVRVMFDPARIQAEQKARNAELAKVDQRIAKLEDRRLALPPGASPRKLQRIDDRLEELRVRKLDLEDRLQTLADRVRTLEQRRVELPAARTERETLQARHDTLEQRLTDLQARNAPAKRVGKTQKELDRVDRRIEALELRIAALERPLGLEHLDVDPLLLRMMALPELPRGAASDIHAHLYGYDHRAGSAAERKLAAQLNAELHGLADTRMGRMRAMLAERVSARMWTTRGIELMLMKSPASTRVLFGNIPQHCGEAHYSHANSPKLTTKSAGRMDVELAEQYMRHWLLYEKEKAAGNSTKADQHARWLARADMSATGVVKGVDPATYLRDQAMKYPGVFKFVGEFTIVKEQVFASLGDESFAIDSALFGKLLKFSADTGMGLLVHCDWGNPRIHSGDGRAEATVMAYENVALLKRMLAAEPNANVVLAHTGIGRLVRPDNSADRGGSNPGLVKVDFGNGRSGKVPQHIAWLYEFAAISPRVRFDVSWNDVAEALTSDPVLMRATIDFILAHPGRVLYGSDTVKPVNSGQYHQSLQTLTPLLAELAYRDPGAAWNLLRMNYENYVNQAEKNVHQWTRDQFAAEGRDAELAGMDARQVVIEAERVKMLAEAKQDFDTWMANLKASPWWAARRAVDNQLGPQADPVATELALTRLLRGDPAVSGHAAPRQPTGVEPASAFRDAYTTLPAADPQPLQTQPHGPGTSWGKPDRRANAYNWARMSMLMGASAVGGFFAARLPHIELFNAGAFAARGVLNGARATYIDAVRLTWERCFENGRFTHADLDRFVNRIARLGKRFNVDPARTEQVALLAEQFRIDMVHLNNRPLGGLWTKDARFHVALAEIGRFQINVDRALGGLQASSMNAADARAPAGMALRGALAGTFVLNLGATAHYFFGGAPIDSLPQAAMMTLFGLGNAALLGHTLGGLASGRSGRNWEALTSFARWTQATGMSLLTAGGVAWAAHDLSQALTHPHPLGKAAHFGLMGMDLLFTKYMARSAETELRRVLRLPMPAPDHITKTAQVVSGILAARVLIGALPLSPEQVMGAVRTVGGWAEKVVELSEYLPLALQPLALGGGALMMLPPIGLRRGERPANPVPAHAGVDLLLGRVPTNVSSLLAPRLTPEGAQRSGSASPAALDALLRIAPPRTLEQQLAGVLTADNPP